MSPQTEGRVKSGACSPMGGIAESLVVGEGRCDGVGLGFAVGEGRCVGVGLGFAVGSSGGVGTGVAVLETPESVRAWHP